MKIQQLEHAVQRSRLLRGDIELVRRVYDDPDGSLEGLEARDAERAKQLFIELVGGLGSSSAELNRLFLPRRVRLGDEMITLRTPLPPQLRASGAADIGIVDMDPDGLPDIIAVSDDNNATMNLSRQGMDAGIQDIDPDGLGDVVVGSGDSTGGNGYIIRQLGFIPPWA
jgi:hypothetical protein